MKKQLFIAIALLACCQPASKVSAQSTFAPLGAEWWYYGVTYSIDIPQQTINANHYTVLGDSVYMGQQCRVVENEHLRQYYFSPDAPAPYSQIFTDISYLLLYSNSDTVFVFNDLFQKFTPLYVFNVNEGDTVCLPAWSGGGNPYANGDTSFCFVIDSVRIKAYDTAHVKTYFTHALYDTSQDMTDLGYATYNWSPDILLQSEGAYTNVTGGIYCGILPAALYFVDTTIADAPIGGNVQLRCYSDNTTSMRLDTVACDYMPTPSSVGIHSIEYAIDNIALYPNPAGNSFTLSTDMPFPATASVVLTDMFGRAIKRLKAVPKGTKVTAYDISEVTPGMYMLHIDYGMAPVYKKLLIIR